MSGTSSSRPVTPGCAGTMQSLVRDIVQSNATGALYPIACFPPPVYQSDMRCTVTGCTCHSKYGDDMTECSQCKNWFHDDCLPTKPPQRVKKVPARPGSDRAVPKHQHPRSTALSGRNRRCPVQHRHVLRYFSYTSVL